MQTRLFLGGALFLVTSVASAETFLYTSALNGFQEVPGTTSQGVGVIQLTLDDSDLSASGTGIAFFLSGAATQFHIHNAPFGSNGPVVLDIGAAAISGNNINFDVTLPSQLAFNTLKTLLDAREGYFNIHTAKYSTGEIRGQIAPVVVPEPVALASLGMGLITLVRRRRKI
jgi:hypothetical protein